MTAAFNSLAENCPHLYVPGMASASSRWCHHIPVWPYHPRNLSPNAPHGTLQLQHKRQL